jgi:hypothetical protein
MRIALSLLSKLVAGIAGVFSLAFLIRRSGESSGAAVPDAQSSAGDQGSRSAYALDLPVHGEPMRPGWSKPAPEKIPHPTYWPMVFGLGVAFLMWGFISNLFVLGLGFFFLVVALIGWVMDLLGEFREN